MIKKKTAEQLESRRAKLNSEADSINKEAKTLRSKRVLTAEERFKLEYDRMLRYNSRIIQRLNTQMEKNLSSRDVYALSTIMSQQREVINDLRAIADLSQQVELIYNQAVNPFISDITQLTTDIYYQLRKLITETSKPKETQFALSQLDELIKHFGTGLHSSHGSLRDSIGSILLGPKEKPSRKRLR
jgi:DNA-directed RNA polymerase